jgi:membrane protease YdiL (CAAX protease family)
VKGLLAGVIIGFFSRKVSNLTKGLIFGFLVGLGLAAIIASFPNPDGSHYWLEIMIPGAIVGLILGWATQRYGKPATA